MPGDMKKWFLKERKKKDGCSAKHLMAHFKLTEDDVSEKTIQRRMGEWLGPTGGARVRCESAVGALNKEDWQQRCEWAEIGKTLRILARMDAFGMRFPERNSGGPPRSRLVWIRRSERWKHWACKVAPVKGFHVPVAWIINCIVRTKKRSNGRWGAVGCAELSLTNTNNETDVVGFVRRKLARLLRDEGYGDRERPLPIETDSGKPFVSDEAEACYKRNNLRCVPLPKRSPDLAVIENFNGWLKKRIAKDVMKRFPNGLTRNKRNIRLWKKCVSKSVNKHTRKKKELTDYLGNLVNCIPKRKRLVLKAKGGPFDPHAPDPKFA